ncbi:unnamed protein product [Coffea canephora]|uniref:Uncharacterized protein n=1 Tax=Coffea canephora TaxID=49390 RepID=A0A068VCW1_COFCA|nr:unnamed protein product [Coffea canephora]
MVFLLACFLETFLNNQLLKDRWWNCWGFWISDSGRFPPLKILDLPLLRPFKSPPRTFLGLPLLRKVYTLPESNRHFQPTSISCADRSSACLVLGKLGAFSDHFGCLGC